MHPGNPFYLRFFFNFQHCRNSFFLFSFSDNTLTNELQAAVVSRTPLSGPAHLTSHGDDEGLLQLEPPLTSSEYSFSLDDQENLNDLFDSLPF